MFAIYLPKLVASWFSSPAPDRGISQNLDEFGDPITDMDQVDFIEKSVLDRFHSAAEYLPTILDRLDRKDIMEFYALYKQATAGPADEKERPSILDVKGRAKFNAWAQLEAMPKDVAMKTYSAKMEDSGWDSSRSQSHSGFGNRPSKMMDYQESGSSSSVEQSSVQDKETALWFAASKADDVTTIKAILSERPQILHQCDPHLGMTALHWAIDSGCDNVVGVLLERGADVNAADPEGNTPLHFAACCHRRVAAELLLTRGADTTIRNTEGMTAAEQCTDEPSLYALLTS